uniref:Protein Nef n=1 Tax=Human immunodeficiency virus type 1 TaxID=11676 RepID=O72639_HV1|nr:nef protein [Human immunodeficiency virus 1]
MGGKWSKPRMPGWETIRERIRRTEPAAEGVGAVSRDLEQRGAITTSNTASNNADCAWLEAQEEEEVGFPVQTSSTLKTNDLQGALDLSHFLRRKGGTGRDSLLPKETRYLDLVGLPHTRLLPDWQTTHQGQGSRYPLTFGWCFKLVPIELEDEVEEITAGERNCLLHPIDQHGMDDPEEEVLVWRFDSRLAFHHIAREKHPEYYKNC